MRCPKRPHLSSCENTSGTALHRLAVFAILSSPTRLVPKVFSRNYAIAGDGLFHYPADIVDDYFEKTNHFPYFTIVDGELAGFVLVRRYPEKQSIMEIGQFFVLAKFTRCGVGQRAFELALKQHLGEWQVRVLLNNQSANDFWQKSIRKFASSPVQAFVAPYQQKAMQFYRFCYQ